jgi:hypothetical protein
MWPNEYTMVLFIGHNLAARFEEAKLTFQFSLFDYVSETTVHSPCPAFLLSNQAKEMSYSTHYRLTRTLEREGNSKGAYWRGG